jgi:hypothetical protein
MDIVKKPAEISPKEENSIEIPTTTPLEVPTHKEIETTVSD